MLSCAACFVLVFLYFGGVVGKVEEEVEGKVRKPTGSHHEVNKVSRRSRLVPQEFWDERPILYMQSGQKCTEFCPRGVMTR